jgi:hypothetical protein
MSQKDDDQSKQQPEAFGDVLAAGGVLIGVSKHAYDAWKQNQPVVKPSEPLTAAIANSVNRGGTFILTLYCQNLGAHGVYLEELAVSDPKGASCGAAVIAVHGTFYEPGFGGGAGERQPLPLPILLPAGKTVCIEASIGGFPKERLAKKPFGKLKLSYTVLGVAESGLARDIEYSVRP